jgi:hypothetical protein
VRSGPGAARTILLFHIISARPSKQPLMVRTFLKGYMELGSYLLFLQEQIKDIIISRPNPRLLTLLQILLITVLSTRYLYDLNLGTLCRFTSLGVYYDLGLGPTKFIPLIDHPISIIQITMVRNYQLPI